MSTIFSQNIWPEDRASFKHEAARLQQETGLVEAQILRTFSLLYFLSRGNWAALCQDRPPSFRRLCWPLLARDAGRASVLAGVLALARESARAHFAALLGLFPFSFTLYPKLLAISHISISISRHASIDDWRSSRLRSMRLERGLPGSRGPTPQRMCNRGGRPPCSRGLLPALNDMG